MARVLQAELDECDLTCCEDGSPDVRLRLERAVFGSDYGADGWTTRDQVDELPRYLDLAAGQRLLDLGSGRGWPGLYLAHLTGCSVVLTDQSVDKLRDALGRARRDSVADRVLAVPATAPTLPFQPGTFDAVVHTDVLCCLGPKLRTLSATRRLLRPGGRTAFFVIHLGSGLTVAEIRAAAAVAPPAVRTRRLDYRALLRSAGFVEVVQIDVTATYAATHRAWLRYVHAFRAELAAAESPEAVDADLARRTTTLDLIEHGVLRRSLLLAQRPLSPALA